jgi:transposase
MKEFRPATIRMHENGYSVKEIAEISQYSTVHDDIKRFEETGLNAERGKTSKARTEENRNVARLIQKDPSSKVNSSRKLAKKWNFSSICSSDYCCCCFC